MDHLTSLIDRREFIRLGALGAPLFPASKAACILIRLSGGLSHLDTFDMKPEAPREIRGEFRPIPTSVPGIRISEHLPRIARQAHRLTILRSMCSSETNHERARWGLEMGRALTPVGEWAGRVECYGDAPLGRRCLEARLAIEAGARLVTVGAPRLAYDTHADNFRRLQDFLLPEFDRAFARLLDELDERGLLATTLVIAAGEFGRTPRINPHGGRDHHAKAWSVVLAGAGLPGGRLLGATDRTGEEVTDLPVSPADLLRTVYEILGVGAPPQNLARGRLVRELFA